jgi:hypothetical protein
MALNLKALEDFKKGESGYATDHGVSRMRSGFVPATGIFVRAVEDVRAGQNGNFEELPQKSK